MVPPPTIISRFVHTPLPDPRIVEPVWAPPKHGKWVIGYKQDGDAVLTVKVRYISEREEYVSIDNQKQKLMGWSQN